VLKGEFFYRYFNERGSFEEKHNGEVNVLCPFPHENGKLEKHSSAHVNVHKGVFHCKTCRALGRLQDGGLSEIGFMAMVYGISYEEAIELFAQLDSEDEMNEETWKRAKDGLHGNKALMEYLTNQRGLTEETIDKYDLAFSGDGIMYPVIVYQQLCDVRTYQPDGKPKIRSRSGASPLLFPFDHWRVDSRPTLLVAGENDCLLTRQNGFNALTVTAGEGSFPKIFVKLFRDKKIYICYDCDEAGRNAARRVAFFLREAGADVYIIDLGLPGTKEDKDLTDFFLKHNKSADDLQTVIDAAPAFTDEEMQEEKNKEYPLVDLWDVAEGKYSGKRISARVVLAGKYDQVMQAPTAVEWACKGAIPGNETCDRCKLKGQTGWWTLNENLKDLMEIVDVTEAQQTKALNKYIKMPDKCPNGSKTVRAKQAVYKVIFTPDVETEDIMSGFRSVEQYAYTVGLNLEDGLPYRAYFRSYPHPLDGQRVFMIVDKVENSDNALNSFQMTQSIYDALKVFQGDPFEKMEEKATRMHGLPDMINKPMRMIADCYNLIYHSPLRIKFNGKSMKGYPEILIIGESQIGKTETGELFQRFIQIGNKLDLKGATTASLLGGADKLNNGGFRIAWGAVPQNNKGLLILDEMSGMHPEVMSSLTAMRSSGVATVPKIKRGRAPANTRLIWTANPVDGKTVQSYANGIQVLHGLVKADEDKARFDVVAVLVKERNLSPLDDPELPCYDREAYRNLIYWVWSRTEDQVIISKELEKYMIQVSEELNDIFESNIKLFGSLTWKRIARIAVSCAANCFSTDATGENIIVTKAHVDWAADFFRRCYDNNIFKLREYAKEQRSYMYTTPAINETVAGMCRTNPQVMKVLYNSSEDIPKGNLQSISGLENIPFNDLINQMFSLNLIYVSKNGVTGTQRFREAVNAYRESYNTSKMQTLIEQESVF
jgi:hypothetical protein